MAWRIVEVLVPYVFASTCSVGIALPASCRLSTILWRILSLTWR